MKDLEAVLFDFDGTLANTEKINFKSWQRVFREEGIMFDSKDYLKYAGKSSIDIVREVFLKENKEGDEDKIKEMVKKRNRYLMEIFSKEGIELMPYAKEIFDKVRKRAKVAIISNTHKEALRFKLNISGFNGIPFVSVDDVKRKKPFPDIYLKGLEILNAKPENSVGIEDTEAGVESAKGAGLFVIAIPNKETYKQDFRKADYITKDLKEAYDIIKKDFIL